MTSKANKSLSFIRRNLQINSKSVKDRAYQSLVRPKLEYCCSVWDQYTTENIYKIEQVQRRTARYACHRHHSTSSVTEMIHSLDWSTLQERRLKTRLHIFYKIINNKIAVSYDNIIIPSQSRTRSTHSNTISQYSATKTHSNFHSSAELSKIGINYLNILQTVTLQKYLRRD